MGDLVEEGMVRRASLASPVSVACHCHRARPLQASLRASILLAPGVRLRAEVGIILLCPLTTDQRKNWLSDVSLVPLPYYCHNTTLRYSWLCNK